MVGFKQSIPLSQQRNAQPGEQGGLATFHVQLGFTVIVEPPLRLAGV